MAGGRGTAGPWRPGSREIGDRGRYLGVLAALVIGDAAFAFQQTAVVPALPTIERDLSAPASLTAWLLSGYLVIASVSGPLLGKLGDRHGKRRLLLVALGCFLLGSVGAAIAPGIGWLIAFRSLQGIGGAVFPLTQSVVRDELPEDGVGTGMGWLTGAFGLGAALGLGLTGFIVEALSWRWIFVAGAGVVLLAAALVSLLVPPSPVRSEARIDAPGALLGAGGLTLVLVPITEGDRIGWLSWPMLALLGGGVALLALWAVRERRASDPLVDLGALANRPVLLANIATFLLGYVLFGLLFLVPHLVETPRSAGAGYGFGATPIGTGLLLLPNAVGQLLAGPVSGSVARRLGPRWPLAGGMVLIALGSGVLAVLHDRIWEVVAGMLVVGAGLGFAIGPAASVVAQGVRRTETGVATGLNSVMRRVGGSVGGQVAAALLAGITVAGGLASETAFVVGFAMGSAVAAAGTVCALLVPRAGSAWR